MKPSDYRAVKLTTPAGGTATFICERKFFDILLSSAQKTGTVEEVPVTEEMLSKADVILK